jgi:quercetin dioxygenase-like cupin family protein
VNEALTGGTMSNSSTSRALAPGEEFLFAGVKMRAFDGSLTGGRYSLIVSEFFAGWETPWHLHRLEDECLYLIRGSVSAKMGDQPYGTLRAGDFIFLPRGVAHGFRVLEETEILTVMTPPGLERFFREASFDFTERDFTPELGTETAIPHEQQYGLEIFGGLPDA